MDWSVVDFQFFMVIAPSKSIDTISGARKCHEYVEMLEVKLRIRLQGKKRIHEVVVKLVKRKEKAGKKYPKRHGHADVRNVRD